jgi:hypothetical protein
MNAHLMTRFVCAQKLVGNVIPGFCLQSVGLFDMDATEIVPDRYRLLHDLAHPDGLRRVDGMQAEEHAYGIKPGRGFLNEYEARTYRRAYPHLYPYGLGCPNSKQGISLTEYFRWAMRYSDGRFRQDKHFYFDLFGIQQKRDVSRSAKLSFRRKDWIAISRTMGTVTANDLQIALEEESSTHRVSNPAIANFIRLASTTRSTVIGSDSSRFRFRSQIWGTSVILGNPSLFLTVNLSDQHDPIAQYLLGEDVDLDNFFNALGPNAEHRSREIIADPFTAAQYFHIVVSAILEHLIGVSVNRNKVYSQTGVLGLIASYFGMVEAQGRGNLHIHLLLWIANTPDAMEIRELLRTPAFRIRLGTYIGDTIHAHAAGVSEERCKARNPHPNPAYCRPPDPHSPEFEDQFKETERLHVESSQYHVCEDNVCKVKTTSGGSRCKRRAPFPTSDSVLVNENGQYNVSFIFSMFAMCFSWF